MKKRILVSCSILAVFLTTILGFSLVKTGSAKRMLDTHTLEQSKVKDAEDNRPLREKAKEARRYSEVKRPNKKAFADLADLNANSSLVIIGIPQENISRLSSDGKMITLDYKVRVEYVYKGAVQEGSTITVSLPGGSWVFDDGSEAEVRTPWFKKMQNGKAYALFLNSSSRSDLFVTTGEAQGLFEIPTTKDSTFVKVQSGLPQDPVWKYQNADVKTFLKELRKVTGKKFNKKP